MTKYRTIVADPPWPYRDANSQHRAMPKRSAIGVNDLGYPSLSVEALCDLEVIQWVEPNAHLYLWTTNGFMVEAHRVAAAWGFNVKTILTWVKMHRDRQAVSMKAGRWFRGATEHILFGVRGRLPLRITVGVPTAFLWPRLGRHSQKPEAFYSPPEST